MNLTLDELGLASDLRVWHAVLLTLSSVAIGVLGGFVGLALGSIRLPILLFVGMPVPTAAGTNILVSSLSAMTGSIRHVRGGRVDFKVVLTMGVPSVAGAFIGGFWSGAAPESLLLAIVAVLVAWQGVEFTIMARKHKGDVGGNPLFGSQSPESESQERRPGLAAVIGLVIGLLGGAVGLILGSIRLPALVRMLKMDLRVVAGTNMLIGFVLGITGWIAHASRGEVDYPILVMMGAGAMVGSQYGAKLTGRASARTLLFTMGWVLVVVAVAMGWQAFRRSSFA
ncbi:MAG: sulfite exporter TauE/SafE family protein [Chloroflexi bacterium]|nr:sulfite exporter TauE/SafE family protein [Chloroflexota bacterium]